MSDETDEQRAAILRAGIARLRRELADAERALAEIGPAPSIGPWHVDPVLPNVVMLRRLHVGTFGGFGETDEPLDVESRALLSTVAALLDKHGRG